jgi:hypothetical protein
MTPRYLTVDFCGHLYEVSHLRDIFDRPTLDPALAERCVVKVPTQGLVAMTTDEAPIYTVH